MFTLGNFLALSAIIGLSSIDWLFGASGEASLEVGTGVWEL
jgi:hypothetical protein